MELSDLRQHIIHRFRDQSLLVRAYVWGRLYLIPVETLLQALQPIRGKMLSIGCGFGPLEIAIALARPDLTIVGSEFSAFRVKAADRASQDLPNLSFKAEDARALVMQDTYNAVLMVDLLHHIPKQSQLTLIQEVSRNIPPYGRLIIKDIGLTPRWKYWWNFFHDKAMTFGDRTAYRSLLEWKTIMETSNLHVERAENLITHQPYPHILLIGSTYAR